MTQQRFADGYIMWFPLIRTWTEYLGAMGSYRVDHSLEGNLLCLDKLR